MALYKYGSSSGSNLPLSNSGKTEFDILKKSHKFLREDERDDAELTWEEQLAKKYYSNLYREYAVCDLKHYKSGNFCLRWRTESEVVSGAGESTCGNTRCPFHDGRNVEELHPSLKTLELPFSYVEEGESKFALVKVVLCDKCCKKLLWKRNKEKERQGSGGDVAGEADGSPEGGGSGRIPSTPAESRDIGRGLHDGHGTSHDPEDAAGHSSRKRRRLELGDTDDRRRVRKSRSPSPSRWRDTSRDRRQAGPS